LARFLPDIRRKIMSIEGIKINYKFSGKPILFDPIEMLRELNFKILESKKSALDLTHAFNQIEDNQLISKEELTPTVVACYEFNRKKVKVIRNVKTILSMTCSRYDFFLDEKLVSVFQRQYDYGKGFVPSLEK